VLILAFDTATPAVTVALHDGARVLAQESAVDARRHGELLAPLVGRVLAAAGFRPADLESIAVGTGPGPYTGLRVGLVTARVLGSALAIAVDGICTLDVIAADRQMPRVQTGDLLAILDVGGYAEVMATQFNLLPRPASVLVHKGDAEPIRRRETYADLTAGQMLPARLI